jgi:hypothetical protein
MERCSMGLFDICQQRNAMARQTIILATACAIGGAIVAALLMARGRDADEAQVAALQRRLDSLESRAVIPRAPSGGPGTVALRDQEAKPPGVSDHLDSRSHSVAGAPPGVTPAPPFMDPVAAAEQRRYEAGVFEQTLSAEGIDVAATNTFSQGLTQAMSGNPELAGSQLVDAQCRVSLCRIAVLQHSDDDVDAFLGSVGSIPGLDTDTYWQRQVNADGSSVMTMYVARPGHKLPDYQMPRG